MSKKVVHAALVVLSLGLVACQSPVSNPAAGSGQAQSIRDAWKTLGDKMISTAEEFPEELYDYKPHPDVRVFGEMLRHLSATNLRYVLGEKGEEYPADAMKPENFQTKADYVAVVRRAYEEGVEVLRNFTDEQMVEPVKNPYGDHTNSRFAYWMEAVQHASEHYGKLVVYYRNNNLVPPSSRDN